MIHTFNKRKLSSCWSVTFVFFLARRALQILPQIPHKGALFSFRSWFLFVKPLREPLSKLCWHWLQPYLIRWMSRGILSPTLWILHMARSFERLLASGRARHMKQQSFVGPKLFGMMLLQAPSLLVDLPQEVDIGSALPPSSWPINPSKLAQWRRFVSFLEGRLAVWQVIRWCATLESCKTGRWHAHLMLQFRGVQDKSSKSFVFERIFPNASSNDYLNEGMGRRNPQQSIDRAFFYVFANKIGTVLDEANLPCVAGNYMPAWVTTVGIDTYRVQGRWPEALWKHYKLEDHMYEQYLYLARDGVQARKRNLDACKAWKEAAGARGDWPSGEADPQQWLLVPTFSSTSWGGSMAESLCFRHAPLPIAHPHWSISLWKDRVCQEPLQAAPGVEGGQHSHLSGQNGWVQAGVPWCFDLGRCAGSRFSSPTSGKAPRKIWQPHRVCHNPGWDMLLHKVFVPNPNGRDNQLHHSQSHILGGEWLAEQVSESWSLSLARRHLQFACANDKLQLLGGLWKRVQVTLLIFPTTITAIWLSVSFPWTTESLNLTYPTSRHASSVPESTVSKYSLVSAQTCTVMVGPCGCRGCGVLASWVRYSWVPLRVRSPCPVLAPSWRPWVPPTCQTQLCLRSWLVLIAVPTNSYPQIPNVHTLFLRGSLDFFHRRIHM